MGKLTRLICFPYLLLGFAPLYPQAADRAHQLASEAVAQRPATCPNAGMTLQACHDRFPDGCSASQKPKYDAYLDFLKDQDPGPKLAPTKDLTAADFPNLESQLLKKMIKLSSHNHAQFSSQFANLGEGNIYTVVAYLYFAEDTGRGTPPNSETANCKLTASDTFDYHLGLGFDPALAGKARTAHPQPGDAAFTELEKDSVVAEMTPYTRHPKWTYDRVNALRGQQVKVVGQLMVDNDHFNAKDDCKYPQALSSCWRSTVWELHPITQFYVCNASGACTASSPATDWTNLDDMP